MSGQFRIFASFAVCLGLLAAPGLVYAQAEREIIDVHMHGRYSFEDFEEVRAAQLQAMEADGVTGAVIGVSTKEDVDAWQGASIIVGIVLAACPRNSVEPTFICFPESEGWADFDWLEENVASGRIGVLQEVAPQYLGLSPSNPRLEPYFALAERYDIPVGFHTQRGPNEGNRFEGCCPNFDPAMGNPALLRPVLDRHPGMRVWIQHVGAGPAVGGPFWDETLALLRDYPGVYLDLSITNGVMPFEQYEAAMRRLFDAGFADRIMFGSDNVPVSQILERMERIEWLTEEDRTAILSGNAKRFFRIPEE